MSRWIWLLPCVVWAVIVVLYVASGGPWWTSAVGSTVGVLVGFRIGVLLEARAWERRGK